MKNMLVKLLNLFYKVFSNGIRIVHVSLQTLIDLTLGLVNKVLWVIYKKSSQAINSQDIMPKFKLNSHQEDELNSKLNYIISNLETNSDNASHIINKLDMNDNNIAHIINKLDESDNTTQIINKLNMNDNNVAHIINKLDNIIMNQDRFFLNNGYFTDNILYKDLLKITPKIHSNDYDKFSLFIKNFIFLLRDFSTHFYEKLNKNEQETFIKWMLRQHAGIDILSQKEWEVVNNEFELAKSLAKEENEHERIIDLSSLGYEIKFHMYKNSLSDYWYLFAVVAEFIRKQYKHDDIYVKNGDVILDCGTFIGDTALAFAYDTGFDCDIHSFEISDNNIEAINKNIEINPKLKNVIKINKLALSNKSDETLYFNDLASGSSIVNNEGQLSVKTITIDDYVKQNNLSKVDFIKMDIEGAEMLALEGASETLKKFKPRLAICVYHKIDDCKTIPEFILKCNPSYELHFGWHNIRDGWESMLYAK